MLLYLLLPEVQLLSLLLMWPSLLLSLSSEFKGLVLNTSRAKGVLLQRFKNYQKSEACPSKGEATCRLLYRL